MFAFSCRDRRPRLSVIPQSIVAQHAYLSKRGVRRSPPTTKMCSVGKFHTNPLTGQSRTPVPTSSCIQSARQIPIYRILRAMRLLGVYTHNLFMSHSEEANRGRRRISQNARSVLRKMFAPNLYRQKETFVSKSLAHTYCANGSVAVCEILRHALLRSSG